MAETPRAREELLLARLEELPGYWLRVRCGGCFRSTLYPCPLMAEDRGRHLRIADVLQRLRCRSCGAAPKAVSITCTPAGALPGQPPPWEQELVP